LGFETYGQTRPGGTFSTDYDTSGKLYSSQLTPKPFCISASRRARISWLIVQFGGRRRSHLGQRPCGRRRADHRPPAPKKHRFGRPKALGAMLDKIGLSQTAAVPVPETKAVAEANKVAIPCSVRPSFVLGGRGHAARAQRNRPSPLCGRDRGQPRRHGMYAANTILVRSILEDALELGRRLHSRRRDRESSAAIMEHIDGSRHHAADAPLRDHAVPPSRTSESGDHQGDQRPWPGSLNGLGLDERAVRGQGTTWFPVGGPIRADTPDAPFVSKALGVPMPETAAKRMLAGRSKETRFYPGNLPRISASREAVFPLYVSRDRLMLGPEMTSPAGLGIDRPLASAYRGRRRWPRVPRFQQGKVFIQPAVRQKPSASR